MLPTYAQAGVWAPVLLIALRLMQGLGAGAEHAGAAVLMAGYAPRHRRGYFAALPFMGTQLGTVLAALIYFLCSCGSRTSPRAGFGACRSCSASRSSGWRSGYG